MSISGEWRSQCMVSPDIEFLNCGTLAPTLRTAFEVMNEARLRWMEAGPGASLEIRAARGYLNMMEEQDKCRQEVAAWLRTAPTSIALLGNTTDGINAALQSVEWQPGDVVLTSNEEHEALRQPLLHLRQRFQIHIESVPFPNHRDDLSRFIDELSRKVTSRTKLVAVSEVSHASGVRLDVKALLQAMSKFPDTWLLLDGAHAAGTTSPVLHEGVDFYAFPAHKWLFGPVETGVLWVSERALRDTKSLLSGAPMSQADGTRYDSEDGAWRYEYGTRDWSKMVGLREAIRFRRQWPEQVLVEHYARLGQAFAEAFESTSGQILLGEAPLYSFKTDDSNRIANVMWETHRVIVKPQDGNVRISLPPWLELSRARELGELTGVVVSEH